MGASRLTALLPLLLLGRLGVAEGQQAERAFVNEPCRVSFRYPASWTVRPDTTAPDRPCRFELRALAYDSLLLEADSLEGVHTILLEVVAQPLADVLPNTAFERRGGGWVVGGRAGLEAPTAHVEGRGWWGVRGEAPVGCYRVEGGYVGHCEVPMALLWNRTHTVTVEGGPGTWDAFDRLLATLELRA